MNTEDYRECICSDPENCREPIPGYLCRKGGVLKSALPPARSVAQEDLPADAAKLLREHAWQLYGDGPAVPPPALEKDNHHSALHCPYCNPNELALMNRPALLALVRRMETVGQHRGSVQEWATALRAEIEKETP